MILDNEKKNVIFSFIYQIVSLVFAFIIRKLIISNLGIFISGINTYFEGLYSAINLLNFGIGSATTYFLYKHISDKNNEKISNYYFACKKLFKCVALFIFIVGVFLTIKINLIVNIGDLNINRIRVYFFVYVIMSVFYYLMTCPRNLLLCCEKHYINLCVDSCCIVVFGILRVLSLLIYKNYLLYLLFLSVEAIISNACITLCLKKQCPFLYKNKNINKEIRDVLSYSKSYAVSEITGYINFNSTNMLINAFCGLETLGLLANYQTIILSIKGFISHFFVALEASIINKINSIKNEIDNSKIYGMVIVISFAIACFVSFCLSGLLNIFVKLFYGESYIINKISILLMVLNLVVIIIQYPSLFYIKAKKLNNKMIVFSIVSVISNILFSIIFSSFFSENGILTGILLSNIMLMLFQDHVVMKNVIAIKKINYIIKYFMIVVVTFICFLIINFTSAFNVTWSSFFIGLFQCIILWLVCMSPLYKRLFLIITKTIHNF